MFFEFTTSSEWVIWVQRFKGSGFRVQERNSCRDLIAAGPVCPCSRRPGTKMSVLGDFLNPDP